MRSHAFSWTLRRPGLPFHTSHWYVLQHACGLPLHLLNVIRTLHCKTMYSIRSRAGPGKEFTANKTKASKEGCPSSPVLFNLCQTIPMMAFEQQATAQYEGIPGVTLQSREGRHFAKRLRRAQQDPLAETWCFKWPRCASVLKVSVFFERLACFIYFSNLSRLVCSLFSSFLVSRPVCSVFSTSLFRKVAPCSQIIWSFSSGLFFLKVSSFSSRFFLRQKVAQAVCSLFL